MIDLSPNQVVIGRRGALTDTGTPWGWETVDREHLETLADVMVKGITATQPA